MTVVILIVLAIILFTSGLGGCLAIVIGGCFLLAAGSMLGDIGVFLALLVVAYIIIKAIFK